MCFDRTSTLSGIDPPGQDFRRSKEGKQISPIVYGTVGGFCLGLRCGGSGAWHFRFNTWGRAGLGHSDRGGRSADGVGTADGPTFTTMALCLSRLIRFLCDYDIYPVSVRM